MRLVVGRGDFEQVAEFEQERLRIRRDRRRGGRPPRGGAVEGEAVDRMQRRQVRNRILGIVALLALCGGGVVTRLFYLQVAAHRRLAARASEQITDRIEVLPKRGVISDRAGRRLAVDVEVESVYGVPKQVLDREGVARGLAELTGREASHYRAQLARGGSFVWLARRVSPAVSAKVAARRWKGVGFLRESRSFYPQREFGAHVLGLAGIDNQGLAGIELAYDRELWRDAVWFVADRDAVGNDIFLSGPPAEALREGDRFYHANVFIAKRTP